MNTLWARAFLDELARSGVRDVCVAPGSRSTPLVLACAADGRFRARVHLDERSAAFFALGVGKATGRPAAVITTSGTATANLLPAVIEASRSETPLLLLTADRPHRLRDADANQAIDQTRLYGPYVREFVEVAPPSLDGPALRHLRALACRTVARSMGIPAGPVHLNFPFDKPLEPSEEEAAAERTFAETHPAAAGGHADGSPFVTVGHARPQASNAEIEALHELLARSPRGLIVAGPSPDPAAGTAALGLGAATGYPVLADPLSGARYGAPRGALVVGAYDLFLRDADVREQLRPELIVRVGSSPTSQPLLDALLHWRGVRHVVVDPGGRWKDHTDAATDYVMADVATTLDRLAGGLATDASAAWEGAWREAERIARVARDGDALEHGPHEGTILAAVAAAMPEDGTLFVSSSMPVRDLDAYGSPREAPMRVLANRGASGIDGVVSTAFGVAAARAEPVACVLGDIAFFHDQNGLLWSRESDAAVVFVLIDNDGGGIFHMLPVREHEPYFTPYFATPHGLDFSHAARLHGIPLDDVPPADVGDALSRALADGATRILRVRTDREQNRIRHRAVADAVTRAVRASLV